MIEYIKGKIVENTPSYTVVEANGVGYFINISLNTYTSLSGEKECLLYVQESIREDAHVLYGFKTKEEREVFRLLISVSGIGANTARMILSSLTVGEFEDAIVSGNVNALKSIKGIGAKTAERAVVDLRDKVAKRSSSAPSDIFATDASFASVERAKDEATQALIMLGFKAQDVQKATTKIFSANPQTTVEDAIKTALKML